MAPGAVQRVTAMRDVMGSRLSTGGREGSILATELGQRRDGGDQLQSQYGDMRRNAD